MTALRRRASDIVNAELLRLSGRLPDLDPHVREKFTRTVRRVVDTLLHAPTVQGNRLVKLGGIDHVLHWSLFNRGHRGSTDETSA